MCGLVGWLTAEKGSDSYDRRKFIDQALIMNTVRGGDSTGVFVVENHWKHGETPVSNWRKQCSGGYEFIISPEYKALWHAAKAMDYKYCVGHNRSATSGGVVIEAAHPFTEGPITLVHNGTVKKEYQADKELANDSHEICWKLSTNSTESVIKELDGAFALIWHDARDDSLNFVRNAQRPLHMAKAAGNDTIYFASEAEMLYWLDKRLTLKLQNIVSMKPAHWLKFTPDSLMVPVVKQVELYSPKVFQSQIGYLPQQWSGTGGTTYGSTNQYQSPGGTKGKSHKPKRTVNSYTHPEKLQEDLLEFGLFVDQKEEFVPMSVEHQPNGDSVTGWILPQDKTFNPIPAIIHGILPSVFPAANKRKWTVMPLGVTRMSWELPLIVCRLKGTNDLHGQMVGLPVIALPDIVPTLKHVLYSPSKKPKAPDLSDVEYPGPNGRMLSSTEWFAATEQGCMCCANPLMIESDAWSLEWISTDTGSRPMCCVCVDSQSKEGDDALDLSMIVPSQGGLL